MLVSTEGSRRVEKALSHGIWQAWVWWHLEGGRLTSSGNLASFHYPSRPGNVQGTKLGILLEARGTHGLL